MLLSIKANNLYKQKKYSESLDIYNKLIFHHPELSKHFAVNIKLCESKLFKQKVQENVVNTYNNIDSLNLEDLLNIDLGKFRSPDFPSVHDLKNLFDSIYIDNPTENQLKSAIKCLLVSPFQRDLLWYCACLLNKLNVKIKTNNKFERGRLTLLSLIHLASDYSYWILNKTFLENHLFLNKINDIRAYDLVYSHPNQLNKNHFDLPERRKISGFTEINIPKLDNIDKIESKSDIFQKVGIGTILLNEKKFIGWNLINHYKMCSSWFIVEGACQGYPKHNVSNEGLSNDRSSVQIRLFPDPCNKLKLIQHGWTTKTGEDAKSELRNRYLEKFSSDYLLVLDADEFYLRQDLEIALNKIVQQGAYAVTLPQVHFWKTTKQIILGKYYDISHTRIFKHIPGMKYNQNHNFPEINGCLLTKLGDHIKYKRILKEIRKGEYDYEGPRCYHFGFAKDFEDMRDKTEYYINRGENITRRETTISRAAWFEMNLPEGCRLKNWASCDLPIIKHLIDRI